MIPQLYTARSEGDLLIGDCLFEGIEYSWMIDLEFSASRRLETGDILQPVNRDDWTYETAAVNFDPLTFDLRIADYLKRQFTEQEVKALSDYLHKFYAEELIVKPIELPLCADEIGSYPPVSDKSWWWHRLHTAEHYTLPFPVTALIDLYETVFVETRCIRKKDE